MQRMVRLWGLAMVVLAACGDGGGAGADDAASDVLVRVDPAGAECAHGGSVISSGLDADHDHLLGDSEVQTRTPVCNAAPNDPSGAVTRLVPEPAGAHCSEGGTAIETGVDGNGNGALDDGEVSHTDYVCGEVLLTRLMPAQTCARSGVAFQVGRDRDHDGQLSDAEVEHTEESCGDVLEGDITAYSATDVAALADIVYLHGRLELRASGQLPKLEVITGGLVMYGAGITDIAAPALESVEGGFVVVSSKLSTLSLPKLARVDGELRAQDNPSLTSIALPALAAVGDALTISNNAQLATVEVPFTRVDGDVSVRGNPQLASLHWSVSSAHALSFTDNGLTSLTLSLSGPAAVLTVRDNPQLASIDLAASALGQITLAGDALTTLAVRATAVEGLSVTSAALDRVKLTGVPGQPFNAQGISLAGPVSTLDAGTPGITSSVCSLIGTKLTNLRMFKSCSFLNADGNTALTEIKLIPLRSFVITNNPVLTSFDSLGTPLRGLMQIQNNPLLSEILLHEVTDLDGQLEVTNNPQLTSFSAPVLADVTNTLHITQSPRLTTLELGQLRRIGYQLYVFGTALTTLKLPRLATGDGFYLDGNPALTHIEMPAVESVHILEIRDNPHLPACEVDALFALNHGAGSQQGNDTTATCTP